MGFVYHHRIGFHDTDGAGVVYFANGLVLCHLAYEASLAAAGVDPRQFFPRLDTCPALAYPIVHASIDFYGPMACGDVLTIDVEPSPVGDSGFENQYCLRLAEQPEGLLAKAKTRHLCIHPTQRQPQPLPETMRRWLQRFESRAIR